MLRDWQTGFLNQTTIEWVKTMVNYYDELGIKPDLDFQAMRELLGKKHNDALRRFNIAHGDADREYRARKELELVEEALRVFATKESRNEYDLQIANNRNGLLLNGIVPVVPRDEKKMPVPKRPEEVVTTQEQQDEDADKIKRMLKQTNEDASDAQNLCEEGLRYLYGIGVPMDFKWAVRCFSKAAEKGSIEGSYRLGSCYFGGYGVPKDYSKAFNLMSKCLGSGFIAGYSGVGACYVQGFGVKKDEDKGMELFRISSQNGYLVGLINIGRCFLLGYGVPTDHIRAIQIFNRCLQIAEPNVRANLQNSSISGNGILKYDEKMYGYSAALYYLGYCHENGCGVQKNYVKALDYFHQCALQPNVYSLFNTLGQHQVGWYYENGYGVRKSPNTAVQWYAMAAERENPDAQNNLGNCYLQGIGVQKDYVKAVEMFRKSAEQGNVLAQVNLGWCYHNGYGVLQNIPEAVEWYEKAKEQGNETAKKNLWELGRKGLY